MKKLLVLFTFLAAVSTTAFGQSKPAEFKFEKETHDFGKISMTKPATVEFKFTNTGDQPLIITKVESTCGCTAPEYTKTPVKTGETGTIKVVYTPAGSPLPFSKSITISSNAKTPVKVLYIKGETVSGK